MGCRIAYDSDQDVAIFYCSTTDQAFGPVFYKGHEHDARERAEAFLRWTDTTETWDGYDQHHHGGNFRDPRQLTRNGLENAYADWCAQESIQWAREATAEAEASALLDD